MDDTGRGDILDAAFHGDVMLLESLVQTPEDANVADQTTGSTPLHEAVVNGHLACVIFLVESYADLEAKDSHGATPLVRPCAPTQLSLSSR